MAVNKDLDTPIFKITGNCIADDLFQLEPAIPQLK
jgi:electron transfer flavoprotein alpha subunit